jgi:hypothetical protein
MHSVGMDWQVKEEFLSHPSKGQRPNVDPIMSRIASGPLGSCRTTSHTVFHKELLHWHLYKIPP